ncbi:MAG TPA: flagellin, partial [Nocardioides sp.]|nr:flagellin [Nocardioides sp.]
VAARNAQDGISVVQTTEGALTEVHSILQRLRDLAVQGANDSNNDDARANIKTESDSLVSELDRIGKSTNFNGTNLLDGSAGELSFQVGADGKDSSVIKVDLSGANVAAVANKLGTATMSGTTFALNTAAAPTYGAAGTFAFTLDDGAGVTSNISVDLAADATRVSAQDLADALNADSTFSASLSASVVRNADGAATGITVRALNGGTVGGGDLTTAAEPNAGVFESGDTGTVVPAGTGGLSFVDNTASQASINLIDQQIQKISTARANLGAYQNRFEHTVNNVNVAIENLSASESRIRDTDMASEMMNFTRSQILSQAGTAMLAQANQASQGVLSLLR